MNERRDSSSFRRRTGARLDVYRAFTRRCAHGSRPSTSVDGVHFSLSNASRPVRCRPKRRPGVRRCRSRVTVEPDRWPAGVRTVLTLNTLQCESRTRLARQARRKPIAVVDVLPECGRRRGVAVSSQPCSL